MTIEELCPLQDCVAVLRLSDGEVLKAKICFADLEYQDIVVDVLETNQPQHYNRQNSAYAIKAAEIESAEKVKIER